MPYYTYEDIAKIKTESYDDGYKTGYDEGYNDGLAEHEE